jgi:diguanylate cyclase (GGDEF)-like protein/PAS domain S-box-containing protein
VILYTAEPGEAGLWRYVSPQIEGILGFSPEEWYADPHLWANQLHPADRERMIASEASHQSSAPVKGAAEYRLLHRDGHAVWIRDDALLLRGEDGQERWHGVLSDVTERKHNESELERRAAQQAAVARLGEHALEGDTTSELMQEAVNAAVALVGVEIAGVAELMPDHGSFLLRAAIGLPISTHASDATPAGGASQAGYTILSGKPVVVTDWSLEDRFAQAPIVVQAGARSGLSVVIEGRSGPFGVLGVHAMAPRHYEAGDVDFVQALANVLGDAVERQLTEDDIRHRALHDPLTGQPNRVLFLDRVQQALERLRRRPSLAAILYLDVDRFKVVNDSLGHQNGDALIAAVAPRLREAVRSSDTVARFGGDQFGILLEDIAGEGDAIEMAERIAGMFTRPFVLDGNDQFVTVSMGIALARGGELPEHLIRENDLRRALQRDELRLDYQPLVSLRDRSIVGVEALLRWEHPKRGLIAPDEFIHVAEENGMIQPIGRWVLECASRQAAYWYQARPQSPPVEMSVNLSAVQVADRDVAEIVAAVLHATGLDPRCLTLEITESVMLADAEGIGNALRALKATGVRLVLDDFGTGYSSLAYVTRLPLDALKVDRSFIDGLGTEPRNTAITEAIVAMSHALSLEVVGEGAETALQVAELTRIGCDFVQGFHFSRPVPAHEITRMLLEGPGWLAGAP